MKRLLTWAAIAAASLAVLFVVASALAWWLLDVDALVREQVAAHEPAIEEALGREVELGAISTRFFPTLGAEIEGIRVAAAPGAAEGAPLLQVRRAGIDIDLLGAILSLGEEISISALYLDGLEIELVREKDGSLSIADLLDRPAAEDEGAAAEGIAPALLDLLGRVDIGEIRLADGTIRLVDRAAGEAPITSVVQKIDLRVSGVKLGETLRFQLQAAAFADERNVDLQAAVGPIPADLAFDGLVPVRDVRAQIKRLDLGPALPYLPLPLRAAVLSADFRLPRLAPGAPAEVEGYVAVQGLHFDGGKPTDVRLDANLVADLEKMGATIQRLRLEMSKVEIAASGALHDLGGSPRFENFVVRSGNFDLQTVLDAFPMAREALPPGSAVSGLVTFDLRASGTAAQQTLGLTVDLGEVDLLLPGVFAKPRATPFALRIDGDFSQSSATLRKANLRLDELDVDLTGTIRDFAQPTYDFSLAARPFSVDRLVRLLPQAAEQMRAANVRAEGKGSMAGHLKGSPGKLSANFDLGLQGIDLELPETTVRGAVQMRVFANGDPAGKIQAGLRFDAGDSVIRIPGTLQKEAATPFVIDVFAERDGDRLGFQKFDVRLAELQLQAKGSVGSTGSALEVTLLPLDLEKLAATVPALPAERLRNGRVEGAMRVTGDPADLSTLAIDLHRFALRLGGSDLAATATVRNLEAPVVQAHLTSRLLDLDELMPPEEAADGAPAAPAEEREDDPSLKALHVTAGFQLDRVRVRKRVLENVRGQLVLRDGVLKVEQASFGLYGGTVRASGTEAEIWRGQMPFKARLAAEKVDVARLVAGEFDTTDVIRGTANLDVQLDGQGFDMEALEQHLTGAWNLALTDGKISVGQITSAVLGGVADLPGIERKKLASEGDVRDLLASFAVEKGKMNLTRPLRMQLDGSRVELGGAVGIGGDLFLEGDYFVTPQLVRTFTGGRCTIEKETAVPLKVTGPATSPSVQPDAKALGLLLAKGCLSGEAQAVAGALAGGAAKQLDEAKAAADRQLQEAKAAADRQIEEAKAEADRLAAEAKAEADRKRRETEAAAKKKAEEEAKKMKKRLGF